MSSKWEADTQPVLSDQETHIANAVTITAWKAMGAIMLDTLTTPLYPPVPLLPPPRRKEAGREVKLVTCRGNRQKIYKP